jgi:threonine synthase
LLAVHAAGGLEPGQRVVCTVTGHGLKDPQWALRTEDGTEVTPVRVPVDTVSVAAALGLED